MNPIKGPDNTDLWVMGPGTEGHIGLQMVKSEAQWSIDLTPGQAWELGQRLLTAADQSIRNDHGPREGGRL